MRTASAPIGPAGGGLRSIFVRTPGLTMHALAAGIGRPRVPIVLIHGFPQTSHAFRHQVTALAAHGHPTYAVDTRGYGRTDKPGTRVSRALLAEDIRRFCLAEGLSDVTVVGHDWGGLIAFKAAIDHPAMFTRLGLIDSPCTVISPDIPHPYWFKAEPLPEAFLASHAADMIEVRLGGRAGTVLGDRPGNAYGNTQPERDVPFFSDADIAHYVASLDAASRANAVQYYRYAMPLHRVIADPDAPNGERYQALSEREVAAMWLHHEGYDAHPWRHEFHDFGPEDRHKRFHGPSLLIYGKQYAARFPAHADGVLPSGDPFAEQYARYFTDMTVRETEAGHYIAEELPELVTGEVLALADR
ncbi:alpha/beta hydrolase [Actinomadura formosensis]|uniref:alpha/beta hydrolase n=2 Tax=Actinomadura formosensis TaxID=60706 RepID=UPI000AEBCC99|nr:alpha/beta fold hydrolase [Actinomadura formosensis]